MEILFQGNGWLSDFICTHFISSIRLGDLMGRGLFIHILSFTSVKVQTVLIELRWIGVGFSRRLTRGNEELRGSPPTPRKVICGIFLVGGWCKPGTALGESSASQTLGSYLSSIKVIILILLFPSSCNLTQFILHRAARAVIF